MCLLPTSLRLSVPLSHHPRLCRAMSLQLVLVFSHLWWSWIQCRVSQLQRWSPLQVQYWPSHGCSRISHTCCCTAACLLLLCEWVCNICGMNEFLVYVNCCSMVTAVTLCERDMTLCSPTSLSNTQPKAIAQAFQTTCLSELGELH